MKTRTMSIKSSMETIKELKMRLRRAGRDGEQKEQRHEERKWIPRGDIAAAARTASGERRAAAERGEMNGDVFWPSCYRRSKCPAHRPPAGERSHAHPPALPLCARRSAADIRRNINHQSYLMLPPFVSLCLLLVLPPHKWLFVFILFIQRRQGAAIQRQAQIAPVLKKRKKSGEIATRDELQSRQ